MQSTSYSRNQCWILKGMERKNSLWTGDAVGRNGRMINGELLIERLL